MGALTKVDDVDAGDWVVIWKTSQGEYRGISLTDFIADVQTLLTLGRKEAVSQYAAPSATGFSVSIGGVNVYDDVHLILTPVAGYAAGAITLPAAIGCRDKQEVTVNCTQAVTALAVNANGALAVTGAPTTLTANAFFKLCYDLPTSTWYRIG
jgi:hypothetical protein